MWSWVALSAGHALCHTTVKDTFKHGLLARCQWGLRNGQVHVLRDPWNHPDSLKAGDKRERGWVSPSRVVAQLQAFSFPALYCAILRHYGLDSFWGSGDGSQDARQVLVTEPHPLLLTKGF